MSIYLVVVAATLVLGALMPQRGRKRIWYILLMVAVHTFICAFRYEHLTGDLMKYHTIFNGLDRYDWFSEEVFQEGRNSGFMLLMKLINQITGEDFQILLILIAVVIHVILGYMIWKYSPAPWMSFLVWNCMSLYIVGFSAIKQALAMSFVMLSFLAISRKKPVLFLLIMTVAGLIHVPSLIFLPAYWLAQMRVNRNTLLLYVVLGILLYIFKAQFVEFIASFYYEEDEVFIFSGEVGSRFVMLLGFALFGILFRGFSNPDFEKLFHLMIVGALLQMLAGFDNIFTRMADYYFQFSVLYIPMTFVSGSKALQRSGLKTVFPFNERSMKVITAVIVVFVIWFYHTYSINIEIAYEVDDYLNFRFMWDVQS